MDVYYKIAFTSLIVLVATTMILKVQEKFPPSRWVMKLEVAVWVSSFVWAFVFVVISIWLG